MTSRSEFLRGCDPAFENYGFDRAAFMALLNNGNTGSPTLTAPQWERGLYFRQWFHLWEAACIIEGIHPREWEAWRWDDVPADVMEMLKAIIDASDGLEVDTDGCGQVQNHHKVSHQSIADWCLKHGLDWPLRQAPAAQQVSGTADAANLAQRLAEAELRAEQLAQELAIITAERDKLRYEQQGLTEELVSAKKEATQSKAALQKAEVDLLQGKSRNFALRLIGGMAMDGYRVAIHQNRLTNLSDILNGLQGIDGAAVGEDALRRILKDAAQLIPPPKPRQS